MFFDYSEYCQFNIFFQNWFLFWYLIFVDNQQKSVKNIRLLRNIFSKEMLVFKKSINNVKKQNFFPFLQDNFNTFFSFRNSKNFA